MPPDIEPRATGHIPEMIVLIRRLIDGGHAYPAAGDVYFDVRSYPAYGALSGQRLDQMRPAEDADDAGGQARPARLHAVEGGQARRAVLGDALGPRPARLAPGMLGHVHQVPRARPSTSTAAGWT